MYVPLYTLGGITGYYYNIPDGSTVHINHQISPLASVVSTCSNVFCWVVRHMYELGAYYNENHLRPNPAKTQLTAFHLKNHQADRKLNVTWNGTKLDHTNSPVYLGITLDRSLTYRDHCLKMRANLSSRNNLLR